jgi:hypothetical protein
MYKQINSIHTYITHTSNRSWMREKIETALRMGEDQRMVVFLDEVNTCNAMGLFKVRHVLCCMLEGPTCPPPGC